VFENVVENAVQWSASGDPVEVVAREFAGSAFVRVTDTGVGMGSKDLERIFDPFFSRRCGSGLGLTISREILQALGGSLGVDSRYGVGTKVTIRIPILAADAVGVEDV